MLGKATKLSVLVIVILIMSAIPIGAHDHARPELDRWYQSLNSGLGPCCDGPGKDAYTVLDDDWESKGGQYRVRIEGQWYDVPANAVLTIPNRDGRTLVWLYKGPMGLNVRCFLPGAMT